MALVAFRFMDYLNVLTGFAGLIIGTLATIIDVRAGGKWFLSGGLLVLFGLFVAIIYASGIVRIVEPDATADAAKLKVLKSTKTDIKPGDWWRVSIESRDDKLLVRVNGKDMAELKHPGTAGDKKGVLVNLYGGIGLIDEVKVMAAGK